MESQAFCYWPQSNAVDDCKDFWSNMDDLSKETLSSADVLDFLGAPKRQCVRPATVPWQYAPYPFHRYATESPLSPWAVPPHDQVQVPHVPISSPSDWSRAMLPLEEWTGAPPPLPVTHVAAPMPWAVPFDANVQESQVSPRSDWSQVTDTYLAPLQELKSAPPPLPKTPQATPPPEKKPYSVSQQMQSAVGPVTVTFLAPTPSSLPAPPPPPPGASRGCRRKPKPKNAQCQVCSQRFESRYKLRVHMNTHTGERPFVCDVCGDAFMRSSTLAAHRRTHEEGKFSCPSCSRTFKRAPERLIHLLLRVCTRKQRNLRKTTVGWHCDACGGSVPRPEEHQCAPMGVRQCPVCRQDFSGIRDYKLLSHVRACHPDYLKSL